MTPRGKLIHVVLKYVCLRWKIKDKLIYNKVFFVLFSVFLENTKQVRKDCASLGNTNIRTCSSLFFGSVHLASVDRYWVWLVRFNLCTSHLSILKNTLQSQRFRWFFSWVFHSTVWMKFKTFIYFITTYLICLLFVWWPTRAKPDTTANRTVVRWNSCRRVNNIKTKCTKSRLQCRIKNTLQDKETNIKLIINCAANREVTQTKRTRANKKNAAFSSEHY